MYRRATKTTNPPSLPDRGPRSTALPPLCTDGWLSPTSLGHLLQLRPRRGEVCRSRRRPRRLWAPDQQPSRAAEDSPRRGDRTGPGRGDRGLSGCKSHELALLFWTEPVRSHLAAFHWKCQGGLSLLLGRSEVLQAAGWAGGLLASRRQCTGRWTMVWGDWKGGRVEILRSNPWWSHPGVQSFCHWETVYRISVYYKRSKICVL